MKGFLHDYPRWDASLRISRIKFNKPHGHAHDQTPWKLPFNYVGERFSMGVGDHQLLCVIHYHNIL